MSSPKLARITLAVRSTRVWPLSITADRIVRLKLPSSTKLRTARITATSAVKDSTSLFWMPCASIASQKTLALPAPPRRNSRYSR